MMPEIPLADVIASYLLNIGLIALAALSLYAGLRSSLMRRERLAASDDYVEQPDEPRVPRQNAVLVPVEPVLYQYEAADTRHNEALNRLLAERTGVALARYLAQFNELSANDIASLVSGARGDVLKVVREARTPVPPIVVDGKREIAR